MHTMKAHRIIASAGEILGDGFWTRFTVQFNLFAGTVLACGNPSQVEQLSSMEAAGNLGCFGLTEKFAGKRIIEERFQATCSSNGVRQPTSHVYLSVSHSDHIKMYRSL